MLRAIFLTLLFPLHSFAASAGDKSGVTNQLTMVTDTLKETPEQLIQRQLDAYNARDLDAFMLTYAEDIVVNNFPNTNISIGKEAMGKRYGTMFESTPDLHCVIKKRIVLGNKIIDHEYVLKNGKYNNVVAVYEVSNGLISKVTFIRE